MGAVGWFSPPPHTVHTFDREVSRALDPGDRRAIYGCSFKGSPCSAIEIRPIGSPSPFALAHAEKQRAKRRRGGS